VVGFFGVSGALVGEQQGADGSYMVWLGEQAYQSPEQLRHAVGTSARSDVYAFGAIVYHLLLGEPPFATAGASVDVARRLTQAPPDLRSRRESVPEGLERVVLTCLARVPADRYGSGVELARALEEAVR
jgi:serine/threonine-protein kinase